MVIFLLVQTSCITSCIRMLLLPHLLPHLLPQDLRDADGDHLVELPRNYLAVVEGLIRKQRSESAALQGWLGPTRFSGRGGICP